MTADQLAAAAARLSVIVAGLTPGDRAELRRMDPRGVLPPACWRLLTEPLVQVALRPPGARAECAERAFAVLIGAMVESPASGPELPIGGALRGSGEKDAPYSEERFVRLLRARGIAEVAFEARQATRWCALKGRRPRFAGFNGFGPFIVHAALEDEEEAERSAHAIARNYFRTPAPEVLS